MRERTDRVGCRFGTGGSYVTCGGCGVGRPPKGFVAVTVAAENETAAHLAQMAQLEAASVVAFHMLHDDLVRHGAPEGLLRKIRRAADDEVRHASVMRREAERFNASVPNVDVSVPEHRSIEELAIANAEEGCVVETYGAALAAVQAREATDHSLRRAMKTIAKEELRHAVLSWELADWFDARLDAPARARVLAARKRSIQALAQDVARTSTAPPALGLPDRSRAVALFDAMRPALERGPAAPRRTADAGRRGRARVATQIRAFESGELRRAAG